MQLSLMLLFCLFAFYNGQAQMASYHSEAPTENAEKLKSELTANPKVYFGTASYYAEKFNGRKTANGSIYDHKKLTAACNVLPLGSWVRITNVKNNKRVIVQINDRLHPKNKRLVDLSKTAAEELGYIAKGLARVKVEVLGKKNAK